MKKRLIDLKICIDEHMPTTLIYQKWDPKSWILTKSKLCRKTVSSWMDPQFIKKCIYVCFVLRTSHFAHWQYTQTVYACSRKTVNRRSADSKWMRSIVNFSSFGGRFMHFETFARIWISFFRVFKIKTFVNCLQISNLMIFQLEWTDPGFYLLNPVKCKIYFAGRDSWVWYGDNLMIKMGSKLTIAKKHF